MEADADVDDPQQVADLIEELKEKGIGILFIDPLYRSLRVGDGASNIYIMGEKLEQVAEQIHRAGITVILCHHFKKQGQSWSDPPELEDLSQSGVAEFGRQFILLKRNEPYQMDGKHSLWLKWGGSAGHQGMGVVQADTGTRKNGVIWNAELMNVEDWKASKQEKKILEQAAESASLEESILSFLKDMPGLSKSRIFKEIKGGRKLFEEAIKTLVQTEQIFTEKQGQSTLHYANH